MSMNGDLNGTGGSYNDMSPSELADLRATLERLRLEKIADAKKALVEHIRAKAGAIGIPLEELMTDVLDGVVPKPGGKLPVKYRGPNGETWSGRGKTKEWLKRLIEAGHRKEEFKV